MNRLADAMEPYLTASGIRYSRNTPDMTAASSIRASNAGNYDLHLALHSNAAPEGSTVRSVEFWCSTIPALSRAAGGHIGGGRAENPLSTAQPGTGGATTSVGEVRRVRAPSVFLELGYHDNADDAAWIKTIWRPWPATSCSPDRILRRALPGASPLASCRSGCLLGLSQYPG